MIQPEKFDRSQGWTASESLKRQSRQEKRHSNTRNRPKLKSKRFQRRFGDESPNPILTTIYRSAAMWGRYNNLSENHKLLCIYIYILMWSSSLLGLLHQPWPVGSDKYELRGVQHGMPWSMVEHAAWDHHGPIWKTWSIFVETLEDCRICLTNQQQIL